MLTLPWGAPFHKEHHRVYGYSDPARATQIVTLRLRATLPVERPSLRDRRRKATIDFVKRRVWVAGHWRNGPAIIADYGSTTLVPPGWAAQVDGAGSLILTSNS